MVAPPSAYSLEGGNQLFNAGQGQDGRFGAGLDREIGAGDWDVGDLSWKDFDLTVTDVSWEASETRELQCPAIEGMRRVGDGNLALAFLRDQRGITLGEVCPSPGRRSGNN
jgi:hypothetical protein